MDNLDNKKLKKEILKLQPKLSFYPLFKLYTDLKQPLEIDKGVAIVTNEIDLNKIEDSTISLIDKYHFSEASHCLRINEEIINPKEASLIFMLSCRLFKCTKVFIRYRLDSSNQKLGIFDTYNYIPNKEVTQNITAVEFTNISTLFKRFSKFKELNTRAGNICYFIGLAYRSVSWLEALIFYVCALETITSSDHREYKITEKFITRINNFIGYDKSKLEVIYNVRSELLHGRYNSKSENKNLELMIIAEEVLRKVFLKILNDEQNFNAFLDNAKRLDLFKR